MLVMNLFRITSFQSKIFNMKYAFKEVIGDIRLMRNAIYIGRKNWHEDVTNSN